ncbi:MAG: hypothetical protein ACI8W7_003259 [Gammaproteobacteria bacterium]|jgi:hypothetical protein
MEPEDINRSGGMEPIVNVAKARLEAGEIAIGVDLHQARMVDIDEIMNTCGFD